jgi:NAD+ kinase
VRCDGLVAATPAGSTGYNLANQGPILAWGVEGYVVSFVAPHTLTARALVVAPDDVLHVRNDGSRDSVDIALDGEPVGELGSGEEIEVGFRDGVGSLAQLPGSNFYRRIREKFGRLAH